MKSSERSHGSEVEDWRAMTVISYWLRLHREKDCRQLNISSYGIVRASPLETARSSPLEDTLPSFNLLPGNLICMLPIPERRLLTGYLAELKSSCGRAQSRDFEAPSRGGSNLYLEGRQAY